MNSMSKGDGLMDEERAQQMKKGVSGLFSRIAPTYDQVGPRFFAYFGQRLVDVATIPVGARVLDVASGRGAVLFPAAAQVGSAGHVTGIDFAEVMVNETGEAIRQRGVTQAEIRQMDAEQLDFPDESFDYVLCGFALFFFPHLSRALAEFRRVLKPGGRIAVSTWGADDDRWQWYGELLRAYRPANVPQPPQELNRFNNAPNLETVMREANFDSVQVIEEAPEFFYKDEEEWWAVQWATGSRYMLEMLSPEALAQFKAAAFEKMQPMKQDGVFPHRFPVLYTLASKG
jgi:ubiquinone/menaquinone biosynthesis C-methylase UbiE